MLWFQTLEQELLYVTWEDLKRGTVARFRSNKYEDHFNKLITLRQTVSVWEYQSKFERGLARVGALSPKRKVSCFVTNLNDSIRTNVQANQPTTLTMAIGLAKLFEGQDLAHIRGTTWGRPLLTNALNKLDIPATTVKKMTTKELAKRMKKGLCFHYNERYKIGHCCQNKFLIEAKWEDKDGDVEMEIEDVVEEIVPAISLHAMSGGRTKDDEDLECTRGVFSSCPY